MSGKIEVLVDFFSAHWIYFLVFMLGAAGWLILNLGLLVGVLIGLFKELAPTKKFFIILSGIFILYLAVVSGPEAYYKMRFPANPFIFILAIYGLNYSLCLRKR